MLSDITASLACPCCGAPLRTPAKTLTCVSGHSFDVAREGYVNLLPGGARASTADTPQMVRARQEFMEAGHFEPLVSELTATVRGLDLESVAGLFVDAGAGTGYLLRALLDAAPDRRGVAIDISKHAARISARSHPRIGALVADVWAGLPLQDGCAALVLNAFAPRNAAEFERILAPGGALVVVTPRPDHLTELVAPLGLIGVDERKEERLVATLSPLFRRETIVPIAYRATLDRSEALSACAMGPSAAHVSADELASRVEALEEPVHVTVAVDVGVYRKRRDSADARQGA